MLTAEQIEDFGTLQLHARHLEVELEFFQKRNAEMAKEIARLKELSPEQLQHEIPRQAEQLAKPRRKVFGESTERRPSPEPPGAEPSKKPQRGHGPTPQMKLPTREVHHRLADNERECPACKGMLEEMGDHTSDTEEVTVEKRRFFLDRHIRHKYRCRCNGAIQTAPGPLRLIKGGRYSIDFAVALEIDKRINHLPLDRLRRQMEREGLVITTQVMWDQEDASLAATSLARTRRTGA